MLGVPAATPNELKITTIGTWFRGCTTPLIGETVTLPIIMPAARVSEIRKSCACCWRFTSVSNIETDSGFETVTVPRSCGRFMIAGYSVGADVGS